MSPEFIAGESYISPSEKAFEAWVKRVEKILGHDLDGNQDTDGYSLDFAADLFDAGFTALEYVAEIRDAQAAIAAQNARPHVDRFLMGG